MENYKVKCEPFQCQWQYMEGGQFKPYNDELHMTIESAFLANPKGNVEIRRGYSRYVVNLATKREKSRYGGGDGNKIRRWVKFTIDELRDYRNKADREAFMGKGLKNSNASKIKGLFKKNVDEDYDPEEDDEPYIGQDGIIEISTALDIDPAADIEILLLSWLMDSCEMGVWTQSEFFLGMSRLKCTSLSQLKKKSPKPEISNCEHGEIQGILHLGLFLLQRQ